MRHLDGRGTAAVQHAGHFRNFFGHFFRGAIAFKQQNGFGFSVVTGFHERLNHLAGAFVHHLEASGNNAGSNHGSYGIACVGYIVKAGHNDLCQCWFGHQFYGDFSNHSQHAFRANHQIHQFKAGSIGVLQIRTQRFHLQW